MLLVFDLAGPARPHDLRGLLVALAVLVDDAVTCSTAAAGGRERLLAARRSVVYVTLVALAPLLPYLFAEDVAQAVAEPLVLAYLLAIIASVVVSVTVTPALALLLRPRTPGAEAGGSPLLRRLEARYTPLVQRVVRAPRPAFGASAAVLVLALVLTPVLPQSLLPSFRDRDLVVRWEAAPGDVRPRWRG